MSENLTVGSVIKKINFWVRLVSLQHGPMKKALLGILHNTSNDQSYIGVPEDPTDLYTYLDTKYRTALELLPKKVLSSKQFEFIFPVNDTKTYSENFDITLLIVVISNCTTLASQNKWKSVIHINDVSLAAYVIRARAWRNWLIHTDPKSISEQDFESKWNEGTDIITNLGLHNFDFKSLKSAPLDPKDDSVMQTMKSYFAICQKQQNSMISTTSQQQSDINSLKYENEKLQEHFRRLECELMEMKKIGTKDRGNFDEMVLPEVIAILNKYSTHWRDELFNYKTITWKTIKHNLRKAQHSHVIEKIIRKRIFNEVTLKVELREEVEKVILDNVENRERDYQSIIQNWRLEILKDDGRQLARGNHWWRCLKKVLRHADRQDISTAIKKRTLLTFARKKTSLLTYEETVRPEVLSIIEKEIGENWNDFNTGSALYKYLTLNKNITRWKALRSELEKRCKDNSIYEEILKQIRDTTLLTYGIQNASRKLKKTYIEGLIDLMITQPIFYRSDDPYITVRLPREEAYVDLAIIKANKRTTEKWLNSKKSDRSFHLDLQYMEKEIIAMENIFEEGDSFVVLRGVGGIGKSTLLDTYAYRWAKGKLLSVNKQPEINFMFRFSCRELNRTKIDTVEDLLKKQYLDSLDISLDDLYEISHKVMILVDGVDELKELHELKNCYEGDVKRASIIRELINTAAKTFKGHKTIIAARPEACHEVRQTFPEERIKVVDICGFNKKSIMSYVVYFLREDPTMADEVYHKLQESWNLLAMARIPVYLWVICNMYLNNVKLEKVNTTTQLFCYACLFFMRNHSCTKVSHHKDCMAEEDPDVIEMIIALADLSMSTLFENKVVFTEDEIRKVRSPRPLEKTGFIEKEGSNYQFKHLVLQQFFCGICIYLTNCFKKYVTNLKFRKECLPIIAGLASIEKSGMDAKDEQDVVLTTLIRNLKESAYRSSWKPNVVSYFYYSRTTIEQYISAILNDTVVNECIIITRYCSDLLSIFYEYQYQLDLPFFRNKTVYISDLFFHHDIRNTIHFLKKCDITNKINQISFSDLSSNNRPDNLIELFKQFLTDVTPKIRSDKKVLKIYGDEKMRCLATIEKNDDSECPIRIIDLFLERSNRNAIDKTFISSLCEMVDEVILHSTINDVYTLVHSILAETMLVTGVKFKIIYDLTVVPSEISKFEVYSNQIMSLDRIEFMSDAINHWNRLEHEVDLKLPKYLNLGRNICIDRELSEILPFFRDVNMCGNKNIFGHHFMNFVEKIPYRITANTFFIKSINLSNCYLNDAVFEWLLPHIPQFESLDISNNQISEKSINKLIDTVKQSLYPKLRDLKLTNIEKDIPDECLINLVTNCFLFRHLDVSHNPFSCNFSPRTCLNLERNNMNIVSLSLAHCNLTDKHVDYLLPILSTVHNLDLGYNTRLTEISVMNLGRYFDKFFQRNTVNNNNGNNGNSTMDKHSEGENSDVSNSPAPSFSNVDTLTLSTICIKNETNSNKNINSSCKNNTEQINSINSPKLESLTLAGCFGISNSSGAYEDLIYCCFKYLKTVNFQHNYVSPAVLKMSADIISKFNVKLSHLSISLANEDDWVCLAHCIPGLTKFDVITSVTMSKPSAKLLVKNIRSTMRNRLCNLKSFGIHGCIMPDEVVAILFPTLIVIPNLDFSGTTLSPYSVSTICSSLQFTGTLDSLDLSTCGITDEHMAGLVSFIVCIKWLNLQKNSRISHEMINGILLQLEEELKASHVFQSLDIGQYKISRI